MKNMLTLLVSLAITGCAFVSSVPISEQLKQPHEDIHHGMSMEQVRTNWGEPLKIIKKNGKGCDEVWVYKPHWKVRIDLCFKNGILVRGLNEGEIVQ